MVRVYNLQLYADQQRTIRKISSDLLADKEDYCCEYSEIERREFPYLKLIFDAVMGKSQSKTTTKEREGNERKDKRSKLLRPIRWLARRFNKTTRWIDDESNQSRARDDSHGCDRLDRKAKYVSKDIWNEKKSRKHRNYFAEEDVSVEEKLKDTGLSDDNIDVIKRLDLSTSFFLEGDQNPGCSYWSEQIQHAKDNSVRMENPSINSERFGIQSSYSKVQPPIQSEISSDRAGGLESCADIIDVNPTIIVEFDEQEKECVETQEVEGGHKKDGHLANVLNSEAELVKDFESPVINEMYERAMSSDQLNLAANRCIEVNEEEKTLDGLIAHLCYFSPKNIIQGNLLLATPNDQLQPPMIEIITEEKAQYIVASILINYTLAKEYAIHGLTEMHTVQMCNALMIQLNYWRCSFPISWFEFYMKATRNSYQRFIGGQVILEKKVFGDVQCSFSHAKNEGWC